MDEFNDDDFVNLALDRYGKESLLVLPRSTLIMLGKRLYHRIIDRAQEALDETSSHDGEME
jgi:hypothetical protein